MNITKYDIKVAKEFLEQFKIKFFIDATEGGAAEADTFKRTVTINKGIIKQGIEQNRFYSILMHEFMHILCGDNKALGHHLKGKKHLKYMKKYGLLTEITVDKMANKLFNQFFPEWYYRQAYRTKKDREWHALYYKAYFESDK